MNESAQVELAQSLAASLDHEAAVVRKNLIGITPQSSRVDIRDEAHSRWTSS